MTQPKQPKADKMTNEITINDITISATFANGAALVSFSKGGKIVKEVKAYSINNLKTIVRPENLTKVATLIETALNGEEAAAYWAAKKAEVDAYESEYQERTGNYETRNAMMVKTMQVQG